MMLHIYAVLDRKAQAFGRPFTIQNDAMAIRAFAAAQSDPGSEISKYPEDFTLYSLGAFDDQTGEIIPNHPKPVTES